MYWQKSCACCRNWKNSLHGSRWLILIGFLKIIGCRLPELSIYKGRLKNKKQPAQPIFLAEPFIPTATPSSLPWERVRERATSRKACIGAVKVLGKIAEIQRYPLPSPPPRGREQVTANLRALQVVWKRMPEISTAGIFQVAFIARQMEQTPRAFFQTTFEPIGKVCAARHARGGLGLQGKWRTRACVPHTHTLHVGYGLLKLTYAWSIHINHLEIYVYHYKWN